MTIIYPKPEPGESRVYNLAAQLIELNIPAEHQTLVALAANGQRNMIGGRPSDAALNEIGHYLANPERYIQHQRELSESRWWQQPMGHNPLASELNGG